MSQVKVIVSGAQVQVASPYLPAFVAGARQIGGKWQTPYWVFDTRDEGLVRKLCMKHYGTDGTQAAGPNVTLRISLDGDTAVRKDSIRLGGRTLARAFGRDSGADIGEGVIVVDGGFTSGGSAKNWTTMVDPEGVTILLRDVPKVMADRLMDEDRESWVKSIAIEPDKAAPEKPAAEAEPAAEATTSVQPAPPSTPTDAPAVESADTAALATPATAGAASDRRALITERDRLLVRLTQIVSQLNIAGELEAQ